MTRPFLELKNITLCAEPSFLILLYFLCKNLLFIVFWTPLPVFQLIKLAHVQVGIHFGHDLNVNVVEYHFATV